MEPALGPQPWRRVLIFSSLCRVKFPSPHGTLLFSRLSEIPSDGLSAGWFGHSLPCICAGPFQLCIELGCSGRPSMLVPRARSWTYSFVLCDPLVTLWSYSAAELLLMLLAVAGFRMGEL